MTIYYYLSLFVSRSQTFESEILLKAQISAAVFLEENMVCDGEIPLHSEANSSLLIASSCSPAFQHRNSLLRAAISSVFVFFVLFFIKA